MNPVGTHFVKPEKRIYRSVSKQSIITLGRFLLQRIVHNEWVRMLVVVKKEIILLGIIPLQNPCLLTLTDDAFVQMEEDANHIS